MAGMKALSVKQPHAGWIADEIKTIETRTWLTKYRGDILICAAKSWGLSGYNSACYPRGVALCIATLVDCRPMTKDDEVRACCELYDGAYTWVLANIRKIEAFPVRGQLRLFDVELPEGVV
jgi:hypothetical protein